MKFKICSRIARSARIPSLSLLASVREKSFDSRCRTKNQTTFRIANVFKAEIRHPKSEMHPFTLFMNVHTIFVGGEGGLVAPNAEPFASFVTSRENDVGRAEIHFNPANLVNPVKKSVALEFSYMVENAVHENFCEKIPCLVVQNQIAIRHSSIENP